MGFCDPVRSASPTSWNARRIGGAANRYADQADTDFLSTLLAMAGHDLRQPLQVITSAHDVLAQILHSDRQREELARAADAAARLASRLSQLVEGLQRRLRPPHPLHVALCLRPTPDALASPF